MTACRKDKAEDGDRAREDKKTGTLAAKEG